MFPVAGRQGDAERAFADHPICGGGCDCGGDHFDAMPELERELRDKGEVAVADMVHKILPEHVNCIVIRHSKALGLANAVLCAALVIGDVAQP